MGHNKELIDKWAPILNSCNAQEDLKSTLATCCETMQSEISRILEDPYWHRENKEFLKLYSIPILARVMTNMNASRIVDMKAMVASVDNVNTKLLCDYVPIGQDSLRGKFASDYDMKELSNLICNRLDATIVRMLRMALVEESTSINMSDIMDIDPSIYHTAIITPSLNAWAFEHNDRKPIINDKMQALFPSDYINNLKTELLIDNSSTCDYVILGNVGFGGATYCPYEPVLSNVKVIDSEYRIEVKSKFGMVFNDVGKHYKMYKIINDER